MKQKQINIGLNVQIPEKECKNDLHCPFHGGYKVHGRVLEGTLVRDVTNKTATMEFSRLFAIPKYERFEKRKTRIKAHVPECMSINKGDFIKIAEGRKISKTKNFVVVGVKQ